MNVSIKRKIHSFSVGSSDGDRGDSRSAHHILFVLL